MTTLNEICNDLWLAVTPNISDDSVLDMRLLKYWVHQQRALWLRNELNKNRTIDDAIIQNLGVVDLSIEDRLYDNLFVQDKKILRTSQKIPVAIELHNSTAITRVGSLDLKERPFHFVEYGVSPWAGNGKFNRNQIYAFLLDGYMYVISNKDNPRWKTIKHINIRGVFENPEEAGRFSNLDGTSCYTDNSQYPINKWMLPYLKDAILKSDLKQFIRPVMDETNDANSNNLEITNEQREK